jgi:transcriptional regulator NrdR family protein
MVCIYCNAETQVVNSRPQKRLNQVWRRRKCLHCHALFSTQEKVSYQDSWRVKTTAGALTPFLKNKLFLSLHKSCGHRKQSIEDATALTDTVISLLRTQTSQGLLETTDIAFTAYEVLNNFDKAAAVHYQAFHP